MNQFDSKFPLQPNYSKSRSSASRFGTVLGGTRHPSGCTGPRQGRKNIGKCQLTSVDPENFAISWCFPKVLFLQGLIFFRKGKIRAQRITRNRNHAILHNFLWSIRQVGSRWKRICRFRALHGRNNKIVPICKRHVASRFPVQPNYS